MKLKINPKQLLSRFINWFNKKHILIIAAILIIAGLSIFVFLNFFQQPPKKEEVKLVQDIPETPKVEPVVIKYYSPLTGVQVADEAATKQPVTGVMIENSPDARPQSGLKDSGVVFEAIAEGGITRFMVLYQSEKPQIIGPVRSLRLYDVEWLAAFNSSIAHVGGSAAALSEIRNGSYRDLDQFFNSNSYWRASDRYSPHNVYTSFAKLDALNAAKGNTSSSFTGFERADGVASSAPTASKINITISSYLFNSEYTYNPTANNYARSQAGAPHTDRESGQITPSVVIAMRVDEQSIFEDGWRENIKTIGSGKATIFQNGLAINATWTKNSRLEQIIFTDEAGKTISLNKGQTWISAVPNDGGDVIWQ